MGFQLIRGVDYLHHKRVGDLSRSLASAGSGFLGLQLRPPAEYRRLSIENDRKPCKPYKLVALALLML